MEKYLKDRNLKDMTKEDPCPLAWKDEQHPSSSSLELKSFRSGQLFYF